MYDYEEAIEPVQDRVQWWAFWTR